MSKQRWEVVTHGGGDVFSGWSPTCADIYLHKHQPHHLSTLLLWFFFFFVCSEFPQTPLILVLSENAFRLYLQACSHSYSVNSSLTLQSLSSGSFHRSYIYLDSSRWRAFVSVRWVLVEGVVLCHSAVRMFIGVFVFVLVGASLCLLKLRTHPSTWQTSAAAELKPLESGGVSRVVWGT